MGVHQRAAVGLFVGLGYARLVDPQADRGRQDALRFEKALPAARSVAAEFHLSFTGGTPPMAMPLY